MTTNVAVRREGGRRVGARIPWAVEFLPGGKFLITERQPASSAWRRGRQAVGADQDGVPIVQRRRAGRPARRCARSELRDQPHDLLELCRAQQDGKNNTAVANGKLVDGEKPTIESVKVI